MAEDQLEEIRRKIDIVEFINEYVPLKKTGRNFKALCPFHSEKLPSFIVSPERQIFKCFGCFPAGAKIKTPDGLHAINKLKKNDVVVSGKNKPRKILFTHKRLYQGKMVTIHLWKLGGKVTLTEDHKIFVLRGANYKKKYKNFSRRIRKYEQYKTEEYLKKLSRYFPIKKIAAGEVKEGDCLLYPIDETIKDKEEINLKNFITKVLPPHGTKPRKIAYKIPVEKDFLELLGYWIAEGSSHRAYIRFSLGSHEEEFAKDIQKLTMKIFGLESRIHKREGNKTGLELTCCHSLLANIFENLCGKGAENKHIPFIFQHLPPQKQEIILKAILRGDGYTRKFSKSDNYYHEITTVSPVLAEQLRDIILRLGFFPTEFIEKAKIDGKGVSHKKAHIIMWSPQKKSRYKLVYKRPNGMKYWVLPVRKLKKKPFKGPVYNLTLEADHSYIAQNFMVANCGQGGDIFKFLMLTENLDFSEALRTLAKRAGIKLRHYQPSESEKQKQLLYEINHLASEYYHYLLTQHPAGKKALRYILGRGITRESLIRFKLGYSPNLWEALQDFLVKKKKYQKEALEKAGLVIKSQKGSGYYDRFRGRLMFTLRDHRNNVAGFAGRTLDLQQEEAKYINTPETLVYHKSDLLYGLVETKQAIKKADAALVVEGELDAISSWQAGVENVIALKGTALTQGQIDLLSRFTQNVVLAMDQDLAGDQAARRGIELADAAGMAIKVIEVKGGKDPDEVAQKSPKLWRQQVKEAVPIYDYYLDSALARFDVQTVDGKRKISQELTPILAKITNKVIQAHYTRQLAERLMVEEEAVVAEIDRFITEEGAKTPLEREDYQKAEKMGRREILEEHLLALAFQSENWLLLKKREVKKLIETPRFQRIVETLGRYLKRYKTLDSQRLAKMLPSELKEAFDKLYLLELTDLVEDEEKLAKELKKTREELNKMELKEKLQEIGRQIKALEEKGKLTKKEIQALKKLHEQFRDFSTELSQLEAE